MSWATTHSIVVSSMYLIEVSVLLVLVVITLILISTAHIRVHLPLWWA